MQKVTEILQKYVEWIAIGLGALFVIWMAYSYILQSPATVQVDGQTLGPGEVARHTQDTIAQQLQSKINNTAPITMAVPHPAQQFVEAMAWKAAPEKSLASIWTPLPANLAKSAEQPGKQGPGGQQPLPVGVALLVAPPAPTPEQARVGRSTVNKPGGPADATMDIDWVTQSFTIPMGALNAAFQQAHIPQNIPQLYSTCFLQLEMVRQEVDVNGKDVGPPTVVQLPANAPNGNAQQKYPGDKAPQADLVQYLSWAAQHTQQILRPDFYTVVKGDPWAAPGTQVAEQQQQYTLDNPPPGWQNDPAWHDAVMRHRQELYKQRLEQQRKSAPARPMPSQFPSAAPALRDPARPAPPARVPNMDPPAAMPAAGEMRPAGTDPAAQAPIPTGEFDPSKFNQPTLVWVHDLNVTPGKTYKYKLRYRIRNPLFGVSNVAKDPQFANVFALVSEDSEWSKPVAVPAKTNFFVARNVVAGATSVQFEVFRWEDGVQHSTFFMVSPGDTIGSPKDGIDYSTDWTLVGFQNDPRTGNVQILLVDKEGTMMTRSSQADQANPLYKTLKDAANAARQASANANAGTGNGAVTCRKLKSSLHRELALSSHFL